MLNNETLKLLNSLNRQIDKAYEKMENLSNEQKVRKVITKMLKEKFKDDENNVYVMSSILYRPYIDKIINEERMDKFLKEFYCGVGESNVALKVKKTVHWLQKYDNLSEELANGGRAMNVAKTIKALELMIVMILEKCHINKKFEYIKEIMTLI